MTREEAHQLVDDLFDAYNLSKEDLGVATVETVSETPKKVLPEGKRAVRTKGQGDRVYYLDEEQGTRQWVTTPEIRDALGFGAEDVVEIDDIELAKYKMASAIYKIDNA